MAIGNPQKSAGSASSWRRILGLATAAALATVVAAPSAAHASNPDGNPPCYGSSCVGQSPYIANSNGSCIDSGILITTLDGGAFGDNPGSSFADLYYSYYCNSWWVQYPASASQMGNTVWVQTKNGSTASGTWNDGVGATEMLSGNLKARACGSGNAVYNVCTSPWSWH